jgi:plastocyanin
MRPRHRTRALILFTSMLATAVVAAPAAGARPVGPTAPAVPGGAILIARFHFLPPILAAAPGTTIVVVNLDYERLTHAVSHSVTALDGSFDAVAQPTALFRVPRIAGLYPWHCKFHHFMKGLLIVPGRSPTARLPSL